MKGVFVKIEKDEIKDNVSELLEARATTVHLQSSASHLKKFRKQKFKLQGSFSKGATELDAEIEKIKLMLPEVEAGKFKFTSQKTLPETKPAKKRRSKYEVELEEIQKRLHSISKK